MFWFHASFLRHYDETKTLLNSQHQFGDIGADGEQADHVEAVDAFVAKGRPVWADQLSQILRTPSQNEFKAPD